MDKRDLLLYPAPMLDHAKVPGVFGNVPVSYPGIPAPLRLLLKILGVFWQLHLPQSAGTGDSDKYREGAAHQKETRKRTVAWA